MERTQIISLRMMTSVRTSYMLRPDCAPLILTLCALPMLSARGMYTLLNKYPGTILCAGSVLYAYTGCIY